MKKAFLLILVVSVVTFLVACGGDGGNKNNANGSVQAQDAVDEHDKPDEEVVDISKDAGVVSQEAINAYRAYRGILVEETKLAKNKETRYQEGYSLNDDPEKVSFVYFEGSEIPVMITEITTEMMLQTQNLRAGEIQEWTFVEAMGIWTYQGELIKELEDFVRSPEWYSNYYSVFATKANDLYYVFCPPFTGGCDLNIQQYKVSNGKLVKGDLLRYSVNLPPILPGYKEKDVYYPYEKWEGSTMVLDPAWGGWEYSEKDDYSSPDRDAHYSLNEQEISPADFFSRLNEIVGSIDTMSINLMPSIGFVKTDNTEANEFSLKSFTSNSMSYNEAISWLDKKIGDTAPVFTQAEASSVRESIGSTSYDAAKALDGDWSTAWCEGVPGSGEGEWIELRADSKQTVSGIRMLNGYFKSEDLYSANNTVGKALIITDDGEVTWELNHIFDGFQEYSFEKPVSTSSIRIVILEADEYGDREDTLVSEIMVF